MIELVFSTEFVQRHHCGDWHDFFVWLYKHANLVVGVMYFAIPATLVHAHKALKRYGPEPGSLSTTQVAETRIAYALFIFFCGVGHLIDNVGAFYVPMYHLLAIWHAMTAGVSVWAWTVTWRHRMQLVVGL